MAIHMTKDEIVLRYKQAKNPTQQITILADLNACTDKDIIDLLKLEGVYSEPQATVPKEIIVPLETPIKPRVDWIKAAEMHANGATDNEIANALSIKRQRVTGWRHDKGLHLNAEVTATAGAITKQQSTQKQPSVPKEPFITKEQPKAEHSKQPVAIVKDETTFHASTKHLTRIIDVCLNSYRYTQCLCDLEALEFAVSLLLANERERCQHE